MPFEDCPRCGNWSLIVESYRDRLLDGVRLRGFCTSCGLVWPVDGGEAASDEPDVA